MSCREGEDAKMQENAQRFFVLTGGPGSGKSALIEALQQCGYPRSLEAGRGIIHDQMLIGGRALPWGDPILFAELMLCWEMRSYDIAQHQTGPVFFDRGVPDVVGYLRLLGRPVPEHMQKAVDAFRYNRRVFIAPPWREIFRRDRNASKASTRPSGPMKPWSRSTLSTATTLSRFRESPSKNESASSATTSVLQLSA